MSQQEVVSELEYHVDRVVVRVTLGIEVVDRGLSPGDSDRSPFL